MTADYSSLLITEKRYLRQVHKKIIEERKFWEKKGENATIRICNIFHVNHDNSCVINVNYEFIR